MALIKLATQPWTKDLIRKIIIAGGFTGAKQTIPNIQIGTVSSGDTANAELVAGETGYLLNLTLPRGAKGDPGTSTVVDQGGSQTVIEAPTISIGTVTSGSSAAATLTKDGSGYRLNLTLPKGERGERGETGATGAPGSSGTPADMSIYYKKTETYSKSEVDQKVAAAQTGGSVDLSNYYNKSEADAKINEKINAIPKPQTVSLENYYKKNEVYSKAEADSKITEKINAIPAQAAKTYEKFVVIGVWGQSNAVGYDESLLTKYDVPRDPGRIFQYSDAKKPLTYCAENLQNMNTVAPGNNNGSRATDLANERAAETDPDRKRYCKTKGIQLPLANLALDVIPDDYGIMIVPAAYGGRGIDSFLKGNSSGYYNQFITRMKAAMNLNADNILSGIVWCQGENDAISNGGMEGTTYVNKFNQLVTSVNTDLAEYAKRTSKGTLTINDWYFYEWPVWFKERDTKGILREMKKLLGNRYVPIPDDTPVNTKQYTAATRENHFGQNAFRTIIAPRVFGAMKANGAFLCNEYDSDTVSITDTSALEAKITALEAKVKALTPKSWRALTAADATWFNNDNKGSGAVADGGNVTIGGNNQASGFILPEDVEGVKLTYANDSNLPVSLVVTYDSSTGAHNSMFVGGTFNTNLWKATTNTGAQAAFASVPNADDSLTLLGKLKATTKGTEVTIMKVDATKISIQIGDASAEEYDLATNGNYVTGAPIRFGFNSMWTGNTYKASNVQVYA